MQRQVERNRHDIAVAWGEDAVQRGEQVGVGEASVRIPKRHTAGGEQIHQGFAGLRHEDGPSAAAHDSHGAGDNVADGIA